MADIEVERLPAIQEGKPDSVLVRLISNIGEVKAFVTICPRFEKERPPFTDAFQVEIHKGDVISPDVDIRLIL